MDKTEITVQVFDEPATIFEKLSNLGYEKIREFQLNDWYYTSLNTNSVVDYKTLMSNSIIVRQIAGSDNKCFLYYKDKKIDNNGNVISEDSIRVELSNLDDTLLIFKKANLNHWCELKQHLCVYRKNEIEFAIQIVEGLGTFIEYEEDDTMKNLGANEKMDYMYSKLKQLGLNIGTDLSCKKIYMKYLKKMQSKN